MELANLRVIRDGILFLPDKNEDTRKRGRRLAGYGERQLNYVVERSLATRFTCEGPKVDGLTYIKGFAGAWMLTITC